MTDSNRTAEFRHFRGAMHSMAYFALVRQSILNSQSLNGVSSTV